MTTLFCELTYCGLGLVKEELSRGFERARRASRTAIRNAETRNSPVLSQNIHLNEKTLPDRAAAQDPCSVWKKASVS